jgi:hypothetical protein
VELDAGEYCRDVESYLCRKNGGHLIRIVGPSFERVCEWVARGVPLKVVYRGIDRYFERYYAKGPRRRPVRVEFCEADVLDVFDEWRRAVGVVAVREARDPAVPGAGSEISEADFGDASEDGDVDSVRHRSSLPAHLERAIARLTALRGGGDRSLDEALDAAARELELMRVAAKRLRGDAREAALERLRSLDATLLQAAQAHLDGAQLEEIRLEAESELAPFRARMPSDAFERSRAACIERIIRERGRLPTLRLD